MVEKPIRRVLVANRGEVVRRVARTARCLGMETVGVYSDPDRLGPWLESVDLAVALPGSTSTETYLAIDKVIGAAIASRSDAIHPGYGFLAENAEFAERCAAAGLTFIGPDPATIRTMGSKLQAKAVARSIGIPTLNEHAPVNGIPSSAMLQELGLRFPLLVKAGSGGGGLGIRAVESESLLAAALDQSRREATSAFGHGAVYIEAYLPRARHIEVQLLGDRHGNVVHLYERECSIQRRHQKLIEESPARLSSRLRDEMCQSAVAIAKAISYTSAGTVEFLVHGESFYFMEMNTRLQVEHPVTEETTGLDIVQLQLEIASGRPLALRQDDVEQRGHSIELRICAESPDHGFQAANGLIQRFQTAAAAGIRYELGVAAGYRVTSYYDSMIAKVVATGRDRHEALIRADGALGALVVHGVETNRAFLRRILASEAFQSCEYNTSFVDLNPTLAATPAPDEWTSDRDAIAAILVFSASRRSKRVQLATIPPGWRNVPAPPERTTLAGPHGSIVVDYAIDPHGQGSAWLDGRERSVRLLSLDEESIEVEVDAIRSRLAVSRDEDCCHLSSREADVTFSEVSRFPPPAAETSRPGAVAPLPGLVVEVLVTEGQAVADGDVLVRLEAMKMVHEIVAAFAATVVEVLVTVGSIVDSQAHLVVLAPRDAASTQSTN